MSVIKENFSNPVIAEVGVFEGALSFNAFVKYNPKKLILIDLYAQYHGNISHASLKALDDRYNRVSKKANSYPNTTLLRSTLKDLESENYVSKSGFPIDNIYVDDDHSYDAALSDLEISSKLLSDKGLIIVDDYLPGVDEYGIIKAVNAFLC